ncbi:hypothetical protein M885DRAFT_521483 [Pelagophyceae sp. CCMP2097]|nr:hypothetical protein M885DRAFT_521483 [Pelagophyceae sp. CCMP2097]|mmetsp:Transcript_4214/g.14820  ORF Transcript_4214/g.14820 Transcript_4214/m.14820 type:complete len:418 (+) Transcript_4214:64-1317(+)
MRFGLFLAAVAWAEDIGPPPDLAIAAICDRVAAEFVTAGGRGHEGAVPRAVQKAASAYKAEISALPMPWRDTATHETFVAPEGEARIPNLAHWAWRSGDADWTLALSVIMARVVQRPGRLLMHTGPVVSPQATYTKPATAAGTEAHACIAAAGVEEVYHAFDPTPQPDGKHPWAEVLKKGGKLSKQTFAHVSDVMRLHTIVEYGGVYLDRDAFLHVPVDHYRYSHDAVLGLEMETHERDHAANFGSFMAKKNATFFRLLWDGMGKEDYVNLSYRFTWGGWSHDSCRKSFALAMKRPDLVHLDERLYQFPFPGQSEARGMRGSSIVPPGLLRAARTHEVLHMSGFEWNQARTGQLRAKPSIWGTVVWPNVRRAALREPALPPSVLRCVDWLESKLLERGYLDEDDLRAINNTQTPSVS